MFYKMIRYITLLFAMVCGLLISNPLSAQWTQQDLEMTFTKVDGEDYELKQLNRQIVIMVLLSSRCDLTGEYINTLNAIQKEFEDYFVIGVFSGKKEKKGRIRKLFKDTPGRFTILIDNELYLAKKFNATVVPEAFILGPQGQVGYRGAIDDRVSSDGSLKKEAGYNYVRNALWQIKDGEIINDPEITATGCELVE